MSAERMTLDQTAREAVKAVAGRLARVRHAAFLDRPAFVVACGRSGSTALCRALGTHSQVLMPPTESPLIHTFGRTAHTYGCGTSRYCEQHVAIPAPRLRRRLRRLCLDSALGVSLGVQHMAKEGSGLREILGARRRLRRWGAKVFPDRNAAEGLLWLFPEARFVYLVRDGRDVVRSMSRFGSFKEMDFEGRCRFWADNARKFNYLRGHPRATTVRFEDFVADPAATFDRLADHLEVDHEDGPARFASSTLVHPLDRPTSDGSPREEYASRPPAHQEWNEAEREAFREICRAPMSSLGYDIPF